MGRLVMSQSLLVVVAVQGIAALLSAVAEAGAQIREQKRLRTADGRTHEVDYVATDASGAEVGVKVDGRSKRATFVPADCDAGRGKALAGRIAQRYARSRVIEELKQKGFSVSREEKQQDGTVKLVLARWR
jgi:hypothetical protein